MGVSPTLNAELLSYISIYMALTNMLSGYVTTLLAGTEVKLIDSTNIIIIIMTSPDFM
jgi:hypothetical protein